MCGFIIIIILHHIITSFHITSHHTSYRINDTRIENGADFWQMLRQNGKSAKARSKLRELQLHQPGHKEGISLCKAWISFLLRSMDLFLYEA
jgi:hypothetical protein